MYHWVIELHLKGNIIVYNLNKLIWKKNNNNKNNWTLILSLWLPVCDGYHGYRCCNGRCIPSVLSHNENNPCAEWSDCRTSRKTTTTTAAASHSHSGDSRLSPVVVIIIVFVCMALLACTIIVLAFISKKRKNRKNFQVSYMCLFCNVSSPSSALFQ